MRANRVVGTVDLPLLFVGDAGLERSGKTGRTFHPARTRSSPVLVADRPWERGRVYLYGTAERCGDEFRLWYGTPKPSAVACATSCDGVNWTKPGLGPFPLEGSTGHNLVRPAGHSPSIWRDERERDPERRYKMLSIHSGGARASVSAEGIRWSADTGVLFESDDTLTLTRHPVSGEFLAYHKRQEMVRGTKRRTVWVSGSDDFAKWSRPEAVLIPTVEDDSWAKENQRTDFYSMSVFPHAGGFVGLPLIFRVVKTLSAPEPNQSPDDGPIDVGLATSADGRTWERAAIAESMIPRGAKGEFDQGAILGIANGPLHVGAESWLYYTGVNTGHGATLPPKQVAIGLAQWRLHGFASLFAEAEPGWVRTGPLRFVSPRLVVNADASGGRLRAALLEEDGSRIEGYTFEACEPMVDDSCHWRLRWKGNDLLPMDRPVRVVIELTSARIYSIFCQS